MPLDFFSFRIKFIECSIMNKNLYSKNVYNKAMVRSRVNWKRTEQEDECEKQAHFQKNIFISLLTCFRRIYDDNNLKRQSDVSTKTI